MANRKKIGISLSDLTICEAVLKEIREKNLLKNHDPKTIKIVAYEKYTPKTTKNIQDMIYQLEFYIKEHGNKRVTKKELCKIIRITRPTLNKWEGDGLVILDCLKSDRHSLHTYSCELRRMSNKLWEFWCQKYCTHCPHGEYSPEDDSRYDCFLNNKIDVWGSGCGLATCIEDSAPELYHKIFQPIERKLAAFSSINTNSAERYNKLQQQMERQQSESFRKLQLPTEHLPTDFSMDVNPGKSRLDRPTNTTMPMDNSKCSMGIKYHKYQTSRIRLSSFLIQLKNMK